MREYIKRFNESLKSAQNLKKEIFSSSLSYKAKEILWDEIISFCIIYKQTAEWYFKK